MSLTKYLESRILNFILLGQAFSPPSLYVGLSLTEPDEGNYQEPSGGSYSRVLTTWSVSSRILFNVNAIEFPEATANWGLIRAFLVFDALEGGNLLFFGNFSNPVYVYSGSQPLILAAGLKLRFLSGSISDYLAEAILKHLAGLQTFIPASVLYLGLASVVNDSDDGSTVSEPGGNYSRQTVEFGTAWQNSSEVDFGTADSVWDVSYVFISDSSTSGEIYFYSSLNEKVEISEGDRVFCPQSSISVRLD